MAPEQIDGKPADERTDIFAFGLVLYELLTGQRAFEGKSAASVMAAILEREPTPISALKPATPPALEQVVLTCLAKDPAERWQSVRELKHALAWASRPGPLPRAGRPDLDGRPPSSPSLLMGIGLGRRRRTPSQGASEAAAGPVRDRPAGQGEAPVGGRRRLAGRPEHRRPDRARGGLPALRPAARFLRRSPR